jgi:chemotaxis protein MotA
MDIMTLAGFIIGVGVILFGIFAAGIGKLFFNMHGIVLVLGGTLAAMVISSPVKVFIRGFKAFTNILRNPDMPMPDDCIRTIVRLSETAQKQGGIMALQNVDAAFALGFLKRAITVAMTSGEYKETREILEEEIRRKRIFLQEDSNFYRTMGVLSPMFGLIGTLFGIIQTLAHISDPTKVGASMAVAISSAFYGIVLSNLVFVPVANKIRLRALEETLALQLILEGVIDIMSGKTPHLIEMHLRGYIESK